MRPWQPRLRGACVAAACLAACAPAGDEATETAAPGISDEALTAIEGVTETGEALVSFGIPPEELITAESIGPVSVGDTLGGLRDALGASPIAFERDFAPGLSAVCVQSEDGAELFCAAFTRANQPSEAAEITRLVTRHPRYKTREGVGPGVTIADAAVVYGEAFLVQNAAGEEFIEFDAGPAGSIDFRPLAPGEPQALVGLYDETDDEIQETDAYRAGAVIGAVEVSRALGG